MTTLRTWNTDLGSWVIDSTTMTGPAWRPLDIEQLWAGAPTRGKTRTVPGVDGSTAYARLKAERTIDVALWITGSVDQSGSPNADPVEGFQANIETLFALVDPPTPPTVARTSTLTLPDGTVKTADVLVEDLTYQREKGFSHLARGVLTITLPDGEHTV